MAHTEITLKDFNEEYLASFVLSLQIEHAKFTDTLGQHLDNLTSTDTVENPLNNLAQVGVISLLTDQIS